MTGIASSKVGEIRGATSAETGVTGVTVAIAAIGEITAIDGIITTAVTVKIAAMTVGATDSIRS
jgi:hypothetical protein